MDLQKPGISAQNIHGQKIALILVIVHGKDVMYPASAL